MLLSASLFQILENNYLREGLVNAGYNKYPQLLDEKKVSALLEKKNLFLHYPSFQCGGLFSKWPENNLNMELLFIVAKNTYRLIARILRDQILTVKKKEIIYR